jgi:hypothetical protein
MSSAVDNIFEAREMFAPHFTLHSRALEFVQLPPWLGSPSGTMFIVAI